MKKFIVGLLSAIVAITGLGTYTQNRVDAQMGTAENNGQWVQFNKFDGFQTKLDAEKVSDGANPNGQNTTINEGDRISVRNLGYDLFPTTATYATSSTKVGSLHNFRRRDGSNIMLRSSSTTLEYYETANTTWETLNTGYTSSDFGFADYNINTDLHSYVYFGNAVQDFSRWNGSHTLINGVLAGGEASITVDDTTGFSATGNLIYCGTTSAYTSLTATTFVLSGTAHACADNRGIAQAVETYAGNPKGNIYLLAQNRLWISGITSTTQAVYFSKYGDATNFVGASLVTDSTADSPGIFNLGEGGGGVVTMTMDESAIYIFKRSIIYKAVLSDSLYALTPLKTFDGKSQTSGAVNVRSTFSGGNGIFYITPDNQIMYLTRVEQVDYPQMMAISDAIKPTIDQAVFDQATGIVYKDKAYISAKMNSDSVNNDVVFVYDIKNGFWESPIIGWNVSDFTIYDEGGEKLFWGDAITPNVYEVNSLPLDYIYGVTANWRSKQFTFSLPQSLKYMDNVFVEGYIAPNTSLTISLLLDDDGYTQKYSTTVTGNDTAYIYASTAYNVFGLSPFGFQRFGSTVPDVSGKKKFRVYLGKDFRLVPFYSAQVEFASDGENQQWEVTSYAFHLYENPVPEKRELFKSFK